MWRVRNVEGVHVVVSVNYGGQGVDVKGLLESPEGGVGVPLHQVIHTLAQ